MIRNDIRNVAIIAHVDHGKTTLVDGFLRICQVFRENEQMTECVLDSNPLERERGITILAKNISVRHKNTKINIIDTPGHSDFGGEVERTLKMADGVLLLVDAAEGPMPQTRFVLRKALGHGLKPIVIINKIDRPDARAHEVLDEVFELFLELGASDQQLDFAHLYCSGRNRLAKREIEDADGGLEIILDEILKRIPGPDVKPDASLQVQITNIDYDNYVGRIGIGRVYAGTVRAGQRVGLVKRDGKVVFQNVKQLYTFTNLAREEVESVGAGDIGAVVGLEGIDIGDTVASLESPKGLPPVSIDEPTVSMCIMVNNSPFAGREGQYVTSTKIRERLLKEVEKNVALRVEIVSNDTFQVSGRGLLHLGVLIETMRREGYEFAVSTPEVIFKYEDGLRTEPLEYCVVDVPAALQGKVIEIFGTRRSEIVSMESKLGSSHIEIVCPARGLIGVRSKLLGATGGNAILVHGYHGHGEYRGDLPGRTRGVLIAHEPGDVTGYALEALEDRGIMFVEPGDKVYEGQVVGEHCKDDDIVVNVCKKKHLTNVRAASAEKLVVLAAPRKMSLEEALEFVGEDELVEVTPQAFRLRKRLLKEKDRKRADRAKAEV